MSVSFKRKLFAALLVASFAYLLIWQVKAIWPFTIDDMFIPLRYAKNWAEGYGLVWNIGEPPVEGYSNFSFVLLGRLAIQWGFNPVLILKNAGIVGLIATSIAIYNISRFWFIPRFAFIPCLWLLMYPGQIIWSVSGLETTVYQALICWSIFFALRGLGYSCYPNLRKSPRVPAFAVTGFLLAIAGFTRPETPALMFIIIALLWFDRPRPLTRSYFQGFALLLGMILLFYVPYFLWRWHYYGHLFPNPVYCKGFAGLSVRMDIDYLVLAWSFALFAIFAIWRAKDRRHFFLWSPSLIYLLLLLGADPVSAFANRLLLLPFVLLLPLTLEGVRIFIYRYFKDDEVFSVAMYLAAFLMAFFFAQPTSLAGYYQAAENALKGEYLRQDISTWLQANVLPNSRVMLSDAGLVPYLNKNPFIDSYCLNNAAMTKPPKADMFRRLCDEILITKPEVIILTSLIEEHRWLFYAPTDACLVKKLKTSGQYLMARKMIAKIRLRPNDNRDKRYYRYEIYTRLK